MQQIQDRELSSKDRSNHGDDRPHRVRSRTKAIRVRNAEHQQCGGGIRVIRKRVGK